jgi:CBS domain-containing protein
LAERKIESLYNQIYKHPLFRGLGEKEFYRLIEKCSLKHYKKSNKVLYSKTPREGLLLILEGMVEVLVEGETNLKNKEVLEVLQTGDSIGFSSLADFLGEKTTHHSKFTVSVVTVEDSYCLQIPFSVLEERWIDEQVRDYVLRQVAVRLKDIYASLTEQIQLASQWGESEPFMRRVQDIMAHPVVTVQETESVQLAAQKMVENSKSSVLVLKNERLVGIVTEKDLVSRVISRQRPLSDAVREIMTENPRTISRESYYYEALSCFLMNGIKHLPVVQEDEVIGIITLSDLLRKKNRGTLQILQTIEKSTIENIETVKDAIYEVLASLLNDRIPILNTLEIITKLYDRLVRHCLELAIKSLEDKGLGKPPVRFCWYQMGSGGRGEQFLLTDQDHFLVYENDKDDEEINHYFKLLGEEIVNYLEKSGYERCIGNMMSNNEMWRGSMNKWKDRLKGWALRATNENLLLVQNFFSFRMLYGDPVLNDQFKEMVMTHVKESGTILYRLAELEKDRPVPNLDHPIRAMFRLERNSIDIKMDALFPLHHCLQTLSMLNNVAFGTPTERIAALVNMGIFTETFAEELRDAFEVILGIRVTQAWLKNQRGEKSSSKINFTQMKSKDKEALIKALKTVKQVQQQVLAAFGML